MGKLKPIKKFAEDVKDIGDLVRFELAKGKGEYTGYYCGKDTPLFYFKSVPSQREEEDGDFLNVEDKVLVTKEDVFKPKRYEVLRRAKNNKFLSSYFF